MALAYRAIDWNRQKRLYDLTLVALLVLALGTFVGVTLWVSPNITVETLIIRGTSISALLLLHVILCVGPLARLDQRFLPWLYNRRHLGVTMFLLALVHGIFSIIQFHALGDVNPLVSVFTAYERDYRPFAHGQVNVSHFPFEPFGAAALLILFLMAATSHDFWLRQLGASFWKLLHLGVYVAYGLILVHVAFGVLQAERSWVYPALLGLGFAIVAGLHLAAAMQETRTDEAAQAAERNGFVDVGHATDIAEGRGKVVVVEGKRLALFRHQNRIFATSNVCRHQGGPIGEGRIVDGCITCPWHGWNYQPEDGCSPPPFHEVLPTYDTKIIAARVWVKRLANPAGTRCAGAAAE
ncbi:MAG TPA: ferric reductase-like transmembrane domain-containing protein [Verrucomicrobiota bacterium]|nr:(2Fe-2S)-binding protein [Verrucomicrobiales bacterium]HRI12813.1 ferric reductase-like transmembrane domain-containing protein [Verrucomicrobiota bacterium]